MAFNFDFMFNRTAEPLTITKTVNQSFDKLGRPVSTDSDPIHVKEPISISDNQAVRYQNSSGGEMQLTTINWVSKLPNMPKHTKVHRDTTDETFEVVSSSGVTRSGKVFYQLERVGDDNVRDSGAGDSESDSQV
ncbi:hypothetical protein [Lactobacillus brevis] [Lactiplantibacillus mudanjiangensis]|uniref:hypothetical protein n=1 Tax=Lactiplantibacillus mudanjiangensis TaxID=1296538 RepID=UPI0010140C6A|nr:hypothetical protein [Lactobacillus brevis] [Lactiplantibacillus mudanjiangensis]